MNLLKKFAFKQMMKIIMSKWVTYPIYAACKLGIPDLLSNQAKSIDELAELTNSHKDALYRLMRALSSIRIFKECKDKKFKLTFFGKTLQSDALKHQAIMFYSDWHQKAWSNLLYSIKTGESGFEKHFGKPCFAWLSENPEAAEEAYNSHAAHAALKYAAIKAVYNFKQFKNIVDIGGGDGELLFNILNDNPNCFGTLADLAIVKNKAIRKFNKANLNSRFNYKETDFFKTIPTGADLYILSHILHDWSDNKCKIILDNCKKVMNKNSKLIIIEFILSKRNKFSPATLLDLEMLVMGGGGRERTKKEFCELISTSNLKTNKIIETTAGVSIVETMI